MLKACASCHRHHAAVEAHCPHCGVGETKREGLRLQAQGPWDRAVKRLKVGGLMAFTAVSASACYGPAMPIVPGNLPNRPKPVASDSAATGTASPKPVASAQATASGTVQVDPIATAQAAATGSASPDPGATSQAAASGGASPQP